MAEEEYLLTNKRELSLSFWPSVKLEVIPFQKTGSVLFKVTLLRLVECRCLLQTTARRGFHQFKIRPGEDHLGVSLASGDAYQGVWVPATPEARRAACIRDPQEALPPRAHLPPSTQTLPASVLMGLRRAASITTHLSLSNRPDWQALVTTDICSCLLICRFMVIAMNNKTQNYLRWTLN